MKNSNPAMRGRRVTEPLHRTGAALDVLEVAFVGVTHRPWGCRRAPLEAVCACLALLRQQKLAGQRLQAAAEVACAAVLKEPAGHGVACPLPWPQFEPAGRGRRAELQVAPRTGGAGGVVAEVPPGEGLSVPAGHGVGAEVPSRQNERAGHKWGDGGGGHAAEEKAGGTGRAV
jgi:hypothetical protein